jgi:hypothetical protein
MVNIGGSSESTTDALKNTFLLDHLIAAADGTDAYPASWASDSGLAKLAAKGNPAAITTYDNTTDSLEAIRDDIDALAGAKIAGKTQIFTKQVTSAADATDVTVATVTTAPVLIKSLTVRANGATTANLTNIGVYGGTSKVVTFINTTDGVKANIDATGEQVTFSLGDGPVYLNTAETIVMTLTGTGAAAVDLQVIVELVAVTDGGYLL